jgi:beta-glucosidase/6-phospho-beta-glucosidase/beta-galactosidase
MARNNRSPGNAYFMFATGIENSYPTIDGGRTRVDEMKSSGHYDRWSEDFDLVDDLGVHYLRYGPPIHTTWLGPGKYDWSFADQTFGALKQHDITPITDLCHFGVPDWIGNFQNPDFPQLFAQYARDFAARFGWVQFFTPVNEIYVCALFSGRFGWWNEQLADDKSFVTAMKHLAKANVLAMRAILDVRPDAIFVQSESSEYFHAHNPAAIAPAEVLNEIRFLSLDLNYGRRVSSEMYVYLMDNGMTRDEYTFFLGQSLKHNCIMGNDYYVTNEHIVHSDGTTEPAGEIFGYHVITTEYYRRYRLPIMHTETNFDQGATGEEAVRWLRKEWANVLRVRNDGLPIVGFTWYSLLDQVDWDNSLREARGTVNPRGLFDMDRKIRPVGEAYRQLISQWRDVLPTRSVVLSVPAFPPSQQDDPLVAKIAEYGRGKLNKPSPEADTQGRPQNGG